MSIFVCLLIRVVAPHVGAWIETSTEQRYGWMLRVAPHVGAWIETVLWVNRCCFRASLPTWERGLKLLASADIDENHVSLPTWERGLKHVCYCYYCYCYYVAPHVGAWIETACPVVCPLAAASLPTWERGLKPLLVPWLVPWLVSLPTWERGLKLLCPLPSPRPRGRSPRGSVD